MNVGAWLMTALSVCRVLVPKELVGKQYHSCFSNVQWPLNYSLRIWRRLEIGGRSAYSSVQCYIPLFLQALWYEHNKYIKSHRLTNRRKTGNVDAILFLSSAAGLALSVERLTTERERTNTQGLKLRKKGTAFALRTVRPSRGSDDNVKWRSRLQ